MNLSTAVVRFALDRPRVLTAIMLALALLLAGTAALPSLWPYQFSFLHPLQVDTDPENMLAKDEPVRIFHNRMKDALNLKDMMVLGVINEESDSGVFNPRSLHRVYALTRFAETQRWPSSDPDQNTEGVVLSDLIAPSVVDNVKQGSLGSVQFEWLMPQPPLTDEAARGMLRDARDLPFLDGTLVSEDGRAVALYLPLTAKKASNRIYSAFKEQMPLIWLWGPMHFKLRKQEQLAESGALGAVQELGRLAAFQAESRDTFSGLMRSLAKRLESGKPAAGLSAVAESVRDWSQDRNGGNPMEDPRVKELKKQGQPERANSLALERAHAMNQALRDHLAREAEQSSGESLWFRWAALQTASLDNRVLGADALSSRVADFAERMRQGLAQTSQVSGLTQQVEQTLQSGEGFPGQDQAHITGLPVAEDTFGVQMFIQMGISAPLAMLVIFLLMLYFFRSILLILPAMIVAMVSVITTMGLLVVTGNTVHIMSSMIPIFIMPIAVLDAVHILSEFYDRYQEIGDRRQTVIEVMQDLFRPMLFTSLTTAAGFASLALTPIPPVQVFGLFVAFGVLMAWIWSITFIPAFITFIPERRLQKLGRAAQQTKGAGGTLIGRMLVSLGNLTANRAKPILGVTLVVLVISAYGISQIVVNDNPINWFTKSHPIRVADRALNEHFGGTYMAYLAFLPPAQGEVDTEAYAKEMRQRLRERAESLEGEVSGAPEVLQRLGSQAQQLANSAESPEQLLNELEAYAEEQASEASLEASFAWDEALAFIDEERQRDQIFKQPESLRYISRLQEHLKGLDVVGKSNSLSDLVKTVHRALLGQESAYSIPDSPDAVAQTLITFQNSHRPQDLWHFTTKDYRRGAVWLQLKSGDNKDMARVVREVGEYTEEHPPPFELESEWFGLTYINLKWQDKMVSGMLKAFLGSFLVVLLLMIVLFRSGLWGILCMIPLTVTIALIYGLIGLVGKSYDMPVAVLSSLSLGLAVDYAIHFLARSREIRNRMGTWTEAVGDVFSEPARAISRNVVVVGAGFLPLLAAPLVPYQTVGALIASILIAAGAASLLILPAIIRLLEPWLFPENRPRRLLCFCGTCFLTAATGTALVLVNIGQFLEASWTSLTWLGIGAFAVFLVLCWLNSKRQSCVVE
ncbi:MAG: MMPL family transporter [Desulfohalobiaceae bacterium]